MNRWERGYADHLELRKRGGEVKVYEFERFKLKLADKTYYTPDFLVVLADDTIELHEVKGHWEEDARVKWKATADRYPIFRFVAVTGGPGKWRYEVAPPHG